MPLLMNGDDPLQSAYNAGVRARLDRERAGANDVQREGADQLMNGALQQGWHAADNALSRQTRRAQLWRDIALVLGVMLSLFLGVSLAELAGWFD